MCCFVVVFPKTTTETAKNQYDSDLSHMGGKNYQMQNIFTSITIGAFLEVDEVQQVLLLIQLPGRLCFAASIPLSSNVC